MDTVRDQERKQQPWRHLNFSQSYFIKLTICPLPKALNFWLLHKKAGKKIQNCKDNRFLNKYSSALHFCQVSIHRYSAGLCHFGIKSASQKIRIEIATLIIMSGNKRRGYLNGTSRQQIHVFIFQLISKLGGLMCSCDTE